MNTAETLGKLWRELYGETELPKLSAFMDELAASAKSAPAPLPKSWFKGVVVYSLYVDLFAGDFERLTARLPYLKDLGATCLWLLPILQSPMKDAGFDISDFRKIRPELVGGDEPSKQQAFKAFLDKAHEQGMRVIFDIAINHASAEHKWFQEALKGPDSPYRDYFIWSDDDKRYAEARIIFKGMMESNWEKVEGQGYYFHRFFEIQPDLNFRNPDVLLDMCRSLLHWVSLGVDGFRADAVPYLWKEEGTNCENLPGTHAIVKFFRAVLDAVRPNTMILAEACQPPKDVVAYFGNSDECHAAYHFPVMPRIFLAMAEADSRPIFNSLAPSFTPKIPNDCGWFSFLRCHDELTLEMVTPDERKRIHKAYCLQPEWDFREGEGVGSRLANLLQNDPRRIALAFSISFTLLGTPVIYYGDEFAKQNDEDYQREQEALTGYKDARYRGRGPVNWEKTNAELADAGSLAAITFGTVRNMLSVRSQHPAFAGGTMTPVDVGDNRVLAYVRSNGDESILCIHNLSGAPFAAELPDELAAKHWTSIYGTAQAEKLGISLQPYGFSWFIAG